MTIDRSQFRPFNYSITFNKIPSVILRAQIVRIPTVSLDQLQVPIDPTVYKMPGDKLQFEDELGITFLMDETMSAYYTMQEWLWEIRNPLDNKTHKPPKECMSDCSINIHGNNQQFVGTFRFFDAFPTRLAGPELTTTSTDDAPVPVEVAFGYNSFRFFPSGYPPIPT